MAATCRKAFTHEQVTVAQVIKTATEQCTNFFDGRPDFVHEALLLVAGVGGKIDGRKLGSWLSANKDRVVDKMRFEQFGTRQNVAAWALRAWQW